MVSLEVPLTILALLFVVLVIVTCISLIIYLLFFLFWSYDRNSLKSYSSALVLDNLASAISSIGSAIFSGSSSAANGITSSLSTVIINADILVILAVMSVGGSVVIEHHPLMVDSYNTARQCYTRPVTDKIVFPILNLIRTFGDIALPIYNAIVTIYKFLVTGILRLLILCSLDTIETLIQEFAKIFLLLAPDFATWSTDFLELRLTIADAASQIGTTIYSLKGILDCMCNLLTDLWNVILLPFTFEEFGYIIDSGINIPISIIQTILNSVITRDMPTFPKTATEFCYFSRNSTRFIDKFVELNVDTWIGISNGTDLDDIASRILRQDYFEIIGDFLCATGSAVNITASALFNIETLFSKDGLDYLQVEPIFSPLSTTGVKIGTVVGNLIGTDRVIWVVDAAFRVIISLIRSVLEIVPGLLNELFYQTHNIFVFLENYWINGFNGGTLKETFNIIVEFLEALEYFIETIPELSSPGCLIHRLLATITRFLEKLIEFVIYISQIFNGRAINLTEINLNPIFDEFQEIGNCIGDFVRQFDKDKCVPTKDNFACCLADFIDKLWKVLSNILRQIIIFAQNLVAEPFAVFKVKLIFPNFDQAIDEAYIAACKLACVVSKLVPGDFKCNVNQICQSFDTCLEGLLCAIFKIPLNILLIANDVFDALNGTGNVFDSVFGLIASALNRVVFSAIDFFNNLGGPFDCVLCKILNKQNCVTVFTPFFSGVAEILAGISEIFQEVILEILEAFFRFIVAFFKPFPNFEALFRFAGKLFDVLFHSIPSILIDTVASFFDHIKLSFIGNILRALYRGVCKVLQTFLNIIARIVDIIPGVNLRNRVQLCCEASQCKPIGDVTKPPTNPPTSPLPLPFSKKDVTEIQTDNPNAFYYSLSREEEEMIEGIVHNLKVYKNAPGGDIHSYEHLELKRSIEQNYENVTNDIKMNIDDFWHFYCNNMTWLGTTDCDFMYHGYCTKGVTYNRLTPLEQSTVMSCFRDRGLALFLAGSSKNLAWIPDDIFYNKYSTIHLLSKLVNGFQVYLQYRSDRSTSPSVIISKQYRDLWLSRGLSVSHLERLMDVEDYYKQIMPLTIYDYFTMNSVDGAMETVAFANMLTTIVQSLYKVVTNVIRASSSVGSNKSIIESTAEENINEASALVAKSFSGILKIIDMSYTGWTKRDMNLKTYDVWQALSIIGERGWSLIFTSDNNDNEHIVVKNVSDVSNIFVNWEESNNFKTPIQKIVDRWDDYNNNNKGGNTHRKRESFFRRMIKPTSQEAASRRSIIVNYIRRLFGFGYYKDMYLEYGFRDKEFVSNYFMSNPGDIDGYLLISPPVCNTSRQIICTDCLVLDQFIYTIQISLRTLQTWYNSRFFNGSASSEWSFSGFMNYTTNSTAPVKVGNGTSPVDIFLPGNDLYQYLGRQKPKRGISDITRFSVKIETINIPRDKSKGNETSTNTFTNFFNNMYTTESIHNIDPDELSLTMKKYMNDNGFTLNGVTITQLDSISIFDFSNASSTNNSLNDMYYDGLLSLGFDIRNLIDKIGRFFVDNFVTNNSSLIDTYLYSFFLCSHTTELDGTGRRLIMLEGVGVILIIYTLVMLPFAFLYRTFIPHLIFMMLASITIFLFFSLTYGWSLLCVGTVPPDIIDDIFEFIVYQLFPKCDYFFGGLIKGPYTVDNCYSCDNVKNFEYYHCRYDIGFEDFLDNIIFFIEWMAPWVLETIRNTRIPILYDLFYKLDYSEYKINKFRNVDFSSQEELPVCLTCEMITFFPNLIIAILVLTVIFLFGRTIVSIIISVTVPLIIAIKSMIMIIYYTQLSVDLDFVNKSNEHVPPTKNQDVINMGYRSEGGTNNNTTPDTVIGSKNFSSTGGKFRISKRHNRASKKRDNKDVHV